MMLTLLIAMVVLTMAMPLLPALLEWQRPSDVVPLTIDETDALDPAYLAHSFATLLATAVHSGATQLGGSDLVALAAGERTSLGADILPLLAAELSAGRSKRVWHVEGDAWLPERVNFYAEVAASGRLETATNSICRALWAGQTLVLAAQTTVLRWAHAEQVRVESGCHLAGRVTAEHSLSVAEGVDFMLLHAPRIAFAVAVELPAPPALDTTAIDWPAEVVWDAQVRRAVARDSLALPAQCVWQGDVVCLDDLELGAHCRADGSLKARGELLLGTGCQVSGSIVAEGAIELGAHCAVLGAVVSERLIVIGPGCTIGAPGQMATVSAPQIEIAAGAVIHGTVWAGKKGLAT